MEPGVESRMQALREDAETLILEPLRIHKWTAAVARVAETEGGYLVINAVRGGKKHQVALLHVSAIRSEVCTDLAAEVEHIFVSGEVDKEVQLGITIPITRAADFFDVLLQWNEASTDGPFVSSDAEEVRPVVEPHRVIQSESPIKAIWARLHQFRSVALARKTIQARIATAGGAVDVPSLQSKAEGLAFAVRNASDYYRLRDEQSVSQRVLNLYYGTLSFAFAEMLSSSAGPTTLGEIEDVTKQGHGLYTVDGARDGIDQLVVGVISSGFFPRWLEFLGKPVKGLPAKKPRTYGDLGKQPAGTHATIEELFARIPDVSDLFFDIFDGPPAWLQPIYDSSANRATSGAASQSRAQTSAYVQFVDRSGRFAKDSIASLPGHLREIAEVRSTEPGRHFRVRVEHPGYAMWHQALPLHHSPFTPGVLGALIIPLFGNVTEFRAIALVLLYGLSIVVRYRPSIWRRVQEGDLDHFKVLVESFLAVVERVLPEQFLATILGVPVYVRQPGLS
jgi:hypothetical protein